MHALNRFKRIAGVALFTLAVGVAQAQPVSAGLSAEEREMIRDSWIFVFHDSVPRPAVAGLAQQAAASAGAGVRHVYQNTIRGFSARMSAQAAARLAANNPNIRYYEADQVARADAKPGSGSTTQPPQQVPWGIARVKGGSGRTCTGKAWVIDTGIDLTHPDLNVDLGNSKDFATGTTTFDDGNGHGTHVSGIIGAKDNGIGVIGVCPGASVVAIRVLNNRGSGTWSDVLAGIDWVGGHGADGDVANMSLGGGYSQSINDAVIAASNVTRFTIAAGNSATNAGTTSPASANGPNIFTVSAFDSTDTFATSFSNYGNPPVDYSGPGVGIYSTYKGSTYKTLSGTSMAAPHVAGVLLVKGSCTVNSTVKNDPDVSLGQGYPDPICEVGQ